MSLEQTTTTSTINNISTTWIDNLRNEIENTNKDFEEKEEIIRKIILERFPGWILSELSFFSIDYDYLEMNWKTFCEQINTTPRKILLVSKICMDVSNPDNQDLRMLCDILTKHGYFIRSYNDYNKCSRSVCNAVIPSENIWKQMKKMNLPVPNIWSAECSTCIKNF